ncbi:CarD family transcriptional regulator [Alkalicella caledoniensis]|uniref:CarD family transcriptional regulator n=1 Tax=Alkalicella caledoniensis TaxID=2731377 RepID=A0A7G9W804_ALKCA|nr:CarD family transcriptional regulator [Alkalicella caledoniensis]QNO14816.1 CarD family transcriptional regulator [Alkalicella caledoniensis]
MFKVGDKVVYPMHGAGVIEGIEEREVLGVNHKYYVLRIPIGSMKVFIPLDKVEEVGVRDIVGNKELNEVFAILQGEKNVMSTNWNRRYRANLEKIKSGDILAIAEVVKDLTIRDKEKGLSSGEKRMLENAKQILISEIVLAKDIDETRADELLVESFA